MSAPARRARSAGQHLPDARRLHYGHIRERLATTYLYVLVLTSVVILLFPVAWMLSTSLKPLEDVFRYPPQWIPDQPTFENYRDQLNPVLGRLFINSVVVGVCSAVLATGAGAFTAYGLSRFRFRGNETVLLFFMASLAFPIPLIMISMYILFVKVHLLNTYPALILGHSVITLPVTVWLLKSFLDTLPREVEEAAFIDGASHFQTLFLIVLPMARPALAAAAIFVFVTSWNELMFGLTFTSSTDMRPIPAGISLIFITEFEGAWPQMMALAIMVSLPVLALFLFFQKTFMQGVTAGAVKG